VRVQGLPIWWDRAVRPGEQYEEGFLHLVTRKDQRTGDRIFDPRRAERLPWCGPTITNCQDPCVKMWDYQEGDRRVNTYIWLEEFDYVVLLRRQSMRKRDVAFLLTAYHIDGPSVRRSFARKYQLRMR
jgi:hypothetical protein